MARVEVVGRGWWAVPAHHSQGPPFPGSAIPTVGHWGGLGLGLGLRIGLGLGLGLGVRVKDRFRVRVKDRVRLRVRVRG